jgi:hypothetical protein
MALELIDSEKAPNGAALRHYRHHRRGVVQVLATGTSVVWVRIPTAVTGWRALVAEVLGRPLPTRKPSLRKETTTG